MATPTNYQLSLQIVPNQIFYTDYQTDMFSPGVGPQQLDQLFSQIPFDGLTGSAMPGFILTAGYGLYSPQQTFRLFMQPLDGSVVVQCIQDGVLGAQTGSTVPPSSGAWNTIWSTSHTGRFLIMQQDGNLVLYNDGEEFSPPEPKAVFASNTSGNPGAFLRMQDDGNLVVYDQNGNPLWATNTNARV